ncbi:MAG: response regulator [Thermoguttaceae bacterium]|nr:response regulator [Thermoguttaceae bacterium]
MNKPLSILLLGQTRRNEFRESVATLEHCGRVTTVSCAAEAEELLSRDDFAADLIVAAQSFPGEITGQAVDRLRRLAPVARVVGLLGSWCEGEMRSGEPWPAAVRAYWHQWPDRCAAELERIQSNRPAAWSLPATATEEERLLLESSDPLPTGAGLIAVRSRSFEMADWLCEACRRQGYATVWLDRRRIPRIEGAAAALLDMADAGPDDLAELEALAAQLRPAPVLALMHFPRTQDVRNAARNGAAGVLSKPVQLEDLFSRLARLCANRG